jgi:HTH-type transcriptional regulator, quorum sensing regulator NprR
MNEAVLFGQLVRATRKARKLRLGQLAEKADTGVKHLGRIERGEKYPSFELIIALAKAMNVSPSVLFEFEGVNADLTVLRAQLRQLLGKSDRKQIQRAHRVLKIILEP